MLLLLATAAALGFTTGGAVQADPLKEIRIDYATYNPVSLVLKEQGLLEKEFAKSSVTIRWVQSLGSNKALEFLNASSIDFGSTAGSASLVARINGNPIKAVYVYSSPEWTALVTRPDSGIKTVADLKGKRVAVTRGTDPHVFLVRALAKAGLSEKDVKLVLLQHGDGRAALDRGDVDAWAGLDPIMATAEIEHGDVLFYRDRAANTPGILNVREAFAKEQPDAVRKVLTAYETARVWSLAHPDDLKAILATVTKLPPPVIARQIDQRTDLTQSKIGEAQRQSILAAGLALKDAGVLPPTTDVKAALDGLIDASFQAASAK
ncbi:aliphatic sulfonate ABC transporter substrate-binding protein [Beijerinckia sp. L45]|uniref:aliphatic sulfonate ABC transporter substrate-binding protein n=1 Tax=Beijerinckia sp. L45 TaxID=1641855 RepID=UPI00131EBC79|nr:aliphatic sulfonate ABC transporter substrate-binding protein [Beijerinckia sp. L45]